MERKKIMKAIVIIAVILIPVMYSFFYLKSYWDPYGNLHDMKLAIVNLDKGEDGENQGQKLLDTLKDKDVITICDVDEETANNGLINQDYYAVLTIPSDFTETLNNASEIDRKTATITFSPNEKTNYLAYQIISKVVTATEAELKAQVSKEVVAKLTDSLEEVPKSLEDISGGADQILDGSTQLENGLNDLNNGVTELNTKYSEFDSGIQSAYEGSTTLNNGIKTLSSGTEQISSGTEQLDSAISQINDGASTLTDSSAQGIQQISSAISQIKTGSDGVNTGVSDYVEGVNTLNTNIEALLTSIVNYGNANQQLLSTDQNFAQIYGTASYIINNKNIEQITNAGEQVKGASSQLNNGIGQLAANSTKLNELQAGMSTLNDSLIKLSDGSKQLKTSMPTLQTGVGSLKTGANALNSGLDQINTSSKTIKNALDTLNNGTQTAYDGSKTLTEGVQTFKTEIDNGIEDTNTQIAKLDGLEEYIKNPVEIKEEPYTEAVATYGITFTPFFLSIGLWVGSLMAYVVLYYDQEKRFKLLGKYADNKLLQTALYFIIAIIQGIITGFLLKWGLGYTIENTALYYFSCVLIAMTFMSIIQFLIVNFNDVGKFIALLLLVLQLASAGGTFPVETISKGFQGLNALMPMTYTIKLLKETIIFADTGFALNNSLVLIAITIVFMLMTIVSEIIRKNRKKEQSM